MTLGLEQPWWLLLVIPAIPAGIVAIRSFAGMSRLRRWSVAIARAAMLALTALLLGGISLVRESDRAAVVAVIDVSGSVRRFFDPGIHADGTARSLDQLIRDFLKSAIQERRPDDVVGIVAFDGSSAAIASPTRADVLDRSFEVDTVEGTDLAGALRLAAALLPSDAAGRLVLFSDGNETTGSALDALSVLGAGSGGAAGPRRVPVDVVPLRYSVSREVFVESVDSPPAAAAGSTVTVRVTLVGTEPSRGTLRLLVNGEPVDANGEAPGLGRRIDIPAGRSVQLVPLTLGAQRLHRIAAIYEPEETSRGERVGDTILANNRAESFTLTPGNGRILVIDGVSGGAPDAPGDVLPGTLRQAGMEVDSVSPDNAPTDALRLQEYDLVILQNVAADAIPRSSIAMLTSYVQDLGGGLIMVGGPDSFGAGGWRGTDLEPLLPVRLDLPEKLIVPAAAIVFVLDNSGSMSQGVLGSSRSKQEIANEGAARAVESLDPTDLVGVVVFNSDASVLVPLAKNTNAAGTAAKIRAISADGGTNMPPGLDAAFKQLEGSTAKIKHVIVLSDGMSADKEMLPILADRMRTAGISVSTIAVGDEADRATMAEMAERGGGKYHRVIDANTLPRIFLRAVRVVRTPMLREERFAPRLSVPDSPILKGLGSLPELAGLVLTQVRPDERAVTALVTPTGEPVLSYWNAGLGRVAAFTSDAHRWGADWVRWPGHGTFWSQLARYTARPPLERAAELTTELDGDLLKLRLDASDRDGRPLDFMTVPGRVYPPGGGTPIETRLEQTGPGIYEASVPAPHGGTHIVALTPRLGDRALAPLVGGVTRAEGVEYRRLTSNDELLKTIAERSGGSVIELTARDKLGLFDSTRVPPVRARLPLWRVLLIWTTIVFFLDIATRRVAWDRFLSGREASARPVTASTGAGAMATLSRLKGRGQEAPAGPGGALTGDDARRIVDAEARRRREQRAQRRAPAPGAPAPDPASTDPRGDSAPTEGLLAAKRRARERMDQPSDLDEGASS